MDKQKRELGGLEAHYHHFSKHHTGHFNLFAFNRFKSLTVDNETMKKAIHVLVKSQPMLRARVSVEKEKYVFNIDDDVKELPIEFIEKDDLCDLPDFIEEKFSISFKEGEYQWRAFIFYSKRHNTQAIVLAMSHAISDGYSFAFFFDSLFRIIDAEKVTLFELKPPVKALNPVTYTEIMDGPDDFVPTTIPALHNVVEENRLTKCAYQRYHSLDGLKEEAHHFGLTLNAFICAAAVLSLARTYNKTLSVVLLTTVNLRNRCVPPIPKEYIGCYIGVNFTYHQNISPSSRFEEIALNYHNMSTEIGHPIAHTIKDGFTIKEIGRERKENIPDMHETPLFISVDNLCELPINGHYNSTEWNSFYHMLSLRLRTRIFQVSLHTFHKALMVTYTHPDKVVTSNIKSKFIDHFEDLLSLKS
jgi:hypothetical protein